MAGVDHLHRRNLQEKKGKALPLYATGLQTLKVVVEVYDSAGAVRGFQRVFERKLLARENYWSFNIWDVAKSVTDFGNAWVQAESGRARKTPGVSGAKRLVG